VITRWRRLSGCGCITLATLLASCSAGDGVGDGVAAGCHGGWQVQTSPRAHESDELSGVSVAAARDVWAVGAALPSGGQARTLAERWQGRGWRRVPTPDRPSGVSFLNGVAAVSASDAWAVGLSRSPGGPARTLVLHWDGRRWSITASPNAGPGNNSLESVAAASPKDAWAVGYHDAAGVFRSLVEHWDGERWTIVRLPRLSGPGDGLNAVGASASGAVWAVGGAARARGPSQPLVLRLADGSWSSVPAPASLHSATLNGVAAAPGWQGAWVVGATRSGGADRAFSLHTDGRHWRVVPVDLTAALSVDLNAIWAAAPDDAWAVGSEFDGRWYRPLVEHLAGGRRSRVSTPGTPGLDARLMAVAGRADGQLWAVGSAARGAGPQRALIVHRCAGPPS